jgi:hypothetical protein
MENSPPNDKTLTQPNLVCARRAISAAACAGEPIYKALRGKPYCILHFPEEKDIPRFKEAIDKKLKKEDFNFRNVCFPADQRFSRTEFTTKADFVDAVFHGRVRFHKAKFAKAAYFNRAKFKCAANFSQVIFRAGVNFTGATFSNHVNFYYAHFIGEVDFTRATFDFPLKFYGATFGDHVRFAGRDHSANIKSLDLQFARIEKPDRVYFHSLLMRPSWFVNVDIRRFDFINVKWDWKRTIQEETDSLKSRKVESAQQMLTIAYRRLAVNAEENHRYDDASRFRYRAMESGRREGNKRFRVRALAPAHWLANAYWLASGYGERVWQALLVLLGILILFAALYTQVGFAPAPAQGSTAQRDEVGAPLTLGRALSYSGAVMTLQDPEPHPATNWAHALVLLETILGPVQAALLALAIRRKFMR